VRIYLTTEGTYPFVMGGVSTWADMLVRGMPDHQFHVAAVVDNPFHPLAFEVPQNVTLQPVPLWGSEMTDEYLAVPGSWRRALRTSGAEVRRRFLGPWEAFVDALASEQASAAALGNTLAEVAHFAERYDLRKALSSQAAWSVLLATLSSHALMSRSSAAGAIDFARSIFRFLLPLCAPIPQCDVAHTSAAGLCALPAVVAKYRYGAPLVLTEHGIYLRERVLGLTSKAVEEKFLQVNFFRAVTDLAYREADVLTPVCGYNAAWEISLGVAPERIRVVHNGLSGEALARLPLRPPEGPPTIGYVGRIDPLKDVATLIRAFALVRKVLVDARLRLWGPATSPEYFRHCQEVATRLGLLVPDGTGPEAAAARAPAKGTGTGAPLVFEGRTDDLPSAYGACHVVALSSVTEGFPYTVVEAMLSGRPVVATDVGGVHEAIGGIGTGAREQPATRGSKDNQASDLLVEPGDPRALAEALLRALTAPDAARQATGAALRARAQAHFDVSNFLNGYSEVYDELASSKGAGLRRAG